MLFFSCCRRYVEKELSFEIGHLPEKHDLSYYPTVHDLQNHIHKALQDIKDGTLPFTSKAVSVLLFIGSRALSFSGPLLSVGVEFCLLVCVSATLRSNISETKGDRG